MFDAGARDLLEQAIHDGMMKGRMEVIESLLANDFRLHDLDHPINSRSELVQELRLLHHGASELDLQLHALYGEPERACAVFDLSIRPPRGAGTRLAATIAVHARQGQLTHGHRVIQRVDSRAKTRPTYGPRNWPDPPSDSGDTDEPETASPTSEFFPSQAGGADEQPQKKQVPAPEGHATPGGPNTTMEWRDQWHLDDNQTEIAQLIMEGHSDKHIAKLTAIPAATVRSTVTLILRRARVSNRVQLLHRAQTLQVL